MQTQPRHEQLRTGIRTRYVQIRTGYIQIRTMIRADTNRDTCRYELGYLQIRTGIRADTNWDTFRYKYVCEKTYINTYEYLQYVFVGGIRTKTSSTYSYVFVSNTYRIRTCKTADETIRLTRAPGRQADELRVKHFEDFKNQ